MTTTQSAHWHKPHEGEHRLPVSLVVLLVIALQFSLPNELSVGFQSYVCGIEAILLAVLIALSPRRIGNHEVRTRNLSLALTGVMTISNTVSAFKLLDALVSGTIKDANMLLLSGGSIWMANIVIFSLWFWELDRGGPGSRAEARKSVPDFLFPQMASPEYGNNNWHPKYFDYFYISVTNASAFSPTDTAPLSRWAKLLMLVQSLTSLVTVGLVIARAVNILK